NGRTSVPLSNTLAVPRLTPKSVASDPGATPATYDAAFTTAPITGTALPAISVRVTVGAAASERVSWLALPVPGVHWKLACPDASAVAVAGVTPPPTAAAWMSAPGYGSPLTSVRRTTTGVGRAPVGPGTWLSPETARSVSCDAAATCTRAKAVS